MVRKVGSKSDFETLSADREFVKENKKTPFDRFEALARGVLNVPHSEVKKKLDEEKQRKSKKRKITLKVASHAADGSS